MGVTKHAKQFFVILAALAVASVIWIHVNLGISTRSLGLSSDFIYVHDVQVNESVRPLRSTTDVQSPEHILITNDLQSTTKKVQREDLFVHLLSYQRSGSSFTGGLFHSNPDAFFIYEPIDMIYAAAFGLEPGWAAPTEIFLNPNKTLRIVPQDEVDIMQFMMEKIYKCEISTLPMPVLTHTFWARFAMLGWMPTSSDYVKCMDSHNLTLSDLQFHNRCRVHIRTVCPKRFDTSSVNLKNCKKVLWNNFKWESTSEELVAVFGQKIAQKFSLYFMCFKNIEPIARKCAKLHLDEPCSNRSLKVIKTVRATMQVGERILNNNPNSKVIHLVRDPRGVAKSRTTSTWAWGIREGRSAGDRAVPYCLQAAEDASRFGKAAAKAPGRTMRLIYDEMVHNSSKVSHDIYAFLNKEMPKETVTFLEKNTKDRVKVRSDNKTGKKTSTTKKYSSYAESWKYFFTGLQIEEIRRVCKRFYSEIPYNWL